MEGGEWESAHAADLAREESLTKIKAHITRFKRSLQKFQILNQQRFLPYAPGDSPDEGVQTRTGGRLRLATVTVDCEECQGREVEVLGGEQEIVHRRKDLLYCEHKSIVTNITYRPTSYVTPRTTKQLYQYRADPTHPSSQLSSRTSEVTPEKLRRQLDELNNLEADASAKHAEFSVILGPLDLDKVARSEGEKKRWSIETMDRWLCNLTELVEDVREQAENVNWVAEETHSTLNSPS